jgi:SPP1 family predicted phage head-tail adaptor
MLASGLLRERITLESRQTTRGAMGGEVTTGWQDQGSTWASVTAISGREANVASQLDAVTSLSVVIRPRTDVQPTWRVRWGERVLSIEAVLPHPAHDRITLLCSEGLNQADRSNP